MNEEITKPLVAGVLLLLTAAFLLKMFIFRVRLNLLEFMFVIVSLSVPLGIVFRANGDKFDKGASDVVALLFVSFFMMVPMIVGAWWGQHSADRLGIASSGQRILLMIAGYAFVVGGFAIPLAFFAAYSAVAGGSIDKHAMLTIWGLAALSLPGFFAEVHCRRVEAHRRRKG